MNKKSRIFDKCFFEVQKRKESKLILIGSGILEENVKDQVKNLKIEDKVYF